MKEFVTANGRIFECSNIDTGVDSISMEIVNQDAADLESFFAGVSSLTTHFEVPLGLGEERSEPILEDPHGFYDHLKLNFVNKNVINNSVVIVMHIKSEIERRLDALEEGQALQDDAITDLVNSVGKETRWRD